MMYKVKNITGKIITFDFDGTLNDDYDGTPNLQKSEIQNILKQLKDLNNNIFIITKRYSSKDNEHIVVYQLAFELGIPLKNIIFTNRNFKAETLINIKSDIHFDDCEYEVQHINSLNHNIDLILVTDPYWRDKIY